MSAELTNAFHRSVDEGVTRLERSVPGLLATGAVGGLDVSMGVFAMFVVQRETGSTLLGALAFGLGFMALTLANSELFTENFLVPVTAVTAHKGTTGGLLRLWGGTVVTNLIGAWIAMGLVVLAFPDVRQTALAVAQHPATAGIDAGSFASAVLGGLLITLMTWMERSTESMPARLLTVVAFAFLLASAPLLHCIVISIEMFAGLQVGAPYGYLDWLGTFAWAAVGNVLGGLGLVTTLRLVQVGGEELEKERQRDPNEAREDQEVDA